MNAFTAICIRDIRSAFRQKGRAFLPPTFFVLIILLFPLALGPEADLLYRAGPGLLTLAALFAAFLPLDTLFRDDYEDGSLDIILNSPAPLSFYIAGKIMAYWLLTGLPLLITAPLLAFMLEQPAHQFLSIIGAFLPMTLLLALIGALGAALSLATKQNNILLALLVMPLYSPVLIFGAHAIDMNAGSPILFLWAMLAVALPSIPLATAAILKGLIE